MARKHAHPEHENHERWLVSYADFITLLFAFFVVMFATTQTDKAKAKQVSDAVKEALENGGVKAIVHEILGGTVDDKGKGNAQMKGPGGAQKAAKNAATAEIVPSVQELSKELENEIKLGHIEVHMEARGLVVSLRQAAFFPSGADTVAPETLPVIQKIAKLLHGVPNSLRVEGHTDSIPIHTARFPSNYELSGARAIAVLNALSMQYDVPRERLAFAGYADTAPVDTNDTEDGRRHNRRVDIIILNQQALINEPGKKAEGKEGAAAGKGEAAKPGAAPSGGEAAKPAAAAKEPAPSK
jgi:chemotaxis protein MotB